MHSLEAGATKAAPRPRRAPRRAAVTGVRGGARTVRPRRRRPRCSGAVEGDGRGGARSSIVLGLGKHLRHVRENRGESVESILNSKSNASAIRARARMLEMLPRPGDFSSVL